CRKIACARRLAEGERCFREVRERQRHPRKVAHLRSDLVALFKEGVGLFDVAVSSLKTPRLFSARWRRPPRPPACYARPTGGGCRRGGALDIRRLGTRRRLGSFSSWERLGCWFRCRRTRRSHSPRCRADPKGSSAPTCRPPLDRGPGTRCRRRPRSTASR